MTVNTKYSVGDEVTVIGMIFAGSAPCGGCGGTGHILLSNAFFTCPVCKGQKIVRNLGEYAIIAQVKIKAVFIEVNPDRLCNMLPSVTYRVTPPVTSKFGDENSQVEFTEHSLWETPTAAQEECTRLNNARERERQGIPAK